MVLERLGKIPQGNGARRREAVRARCDCGTEKVIFERNILIGNTQSCGCLCRERVSAARRIHGEVGPKRSSPEYEVWQRIIQRCYDTNKDNYEKYGGAGITVCNRWLVGENGEHAFTCFLKDMGRKPTRAHSIDRFPNRDGNYQPGNCRWATMTQQNRNKNNNRLVNFMGRVMCVAEACELVDIPHWKALSRLNAGWSVHRAFTE